jgi:hypothetical protein
VIALLAPQMHKPPAVHVQDDATRLCRGGSPHPLLLAYHVFGLDLCRRRSEYSCSAGAAGVRAREPCRPPHWGRRGTSARAAPTAASGRAVLRPRVETREIDRERERRQREEDAFSHRQVGWIFSIAAAIVSYKSINSVFSMPRR